MEQVQFGPFRLDPASRSLRNGNRVTALRPKTLDLLLLLLRRAGEVVSKSEIFANVWRETAVSQFVLTTCINELRAALGDNAKQPRYLKTIHRTGYRLDTGPVQGLDPAPHHEPGDTIVGRAAELARLRQLLTLALQGQRQIVFITGEMGIGKTTLAEQFMQLAAGVTLSHTNSDSTDRRRPRKAATAALLSRGQCVEQYGASEPYMPVFEAIGRLGRQSDPESVVEVLRDHAPEWLVQIPRLLPAEQRAELRRELQGETQEHMLRTIADGIEALAENRLLVLLLEDLHLGDFATLELLAALALRRGPAHLVVLGTFRAAEEYPATARFQSLKQQLLLHRQCEEIALGPLRFAEIESYLAKRFPALQLPEGLPELLYRRTDGNPLFVGRLVDRWAEGGILRADPVRNVLEFDNTSATTQIPGSLRAMIEQRAAALEEGERAILECASVAGVQFFSRAVAAAAGMQREEVEAICSGLVRRHGFLVALDTNDPTLPDLGAHYAFSHGLYQQVLYQQVDPTRRQRFHRSVAESLREAWSSRSKEIAPELASHFENGADLRQAVHYFEQAAARAAEQGANREAVGYLDRGLRLLERGDGDEILNRRLDLLILRGPALLASYGYASLHVFENYAKALEIAQTLANPIRQMSSLLALSVFQQTRGELTAAAELALELVRVTEKAGFPEPILAQVRNPLSQALMYQGRVEESLRLSDAAVAGMLLFPMPTTAPDNRPSIWADPSVMLYCQQGSVSFAAGRIRQAKAAVDEALRIAREIRHPFNLASVLTFTAVFEDTAGNWPSAIAAAEEAIGIAHRYDFPFWQGLAEIVHGHATARMGKSKGGAARLREGIARLRETGAQLGTCNYLNLLADALLTEGDPTAARTSLDESEARAEATGERAFLAETYRLRAECLYRTGRPTSARDSLKQAIKIARQQANRIWELRAGLALHQHWPSAQTRRALAAAAHVFDGEIATADVSAARTALADGA